MMMSVAAGGWRDFDVPVADRRGPAVVFLRHDPRSVLACVGLRSR